MHAVREFLHSGFASLQTRITILYAALFGAVMIALSVALNVVVASNVERNVGAELQSSGATFERIRALQAERLEQGGAVLAQDFGFRQAVATGDNATIDSALTNLSARLKVDRAFILKPDAGAAGVGAPVGLATAALAARLDPYEGSSGVVLIGGRPFMAVAAPILAPDPQGWVVFVLKLGRSELAELEKTASIPLHAGISLDGAAPASPKLAQLLRQAHAGRVAPPAVIDRAMVLARPISRLDDPRPVALTLSYSMQAATAPYRNIMHLLLAAGVVGFGALSFGGWFLARGVTQPVRALDEAAQALGRGEQPRLEIVGRDELARLSQSFDGMARTIQDREAHITRLAHADAETGLANRRALAHEIDRLLVQDRQSVAVAEVRVDRFAQIRAAIGHGLALELVKEVGDRLGQLGFEGVARMTTSTLGFAFPCGGIVETERRLAELGPALRASFVVNGSPIDITCTVGFAVSPGHGESADLLLERAAIALEQAAGSPRRLAAFDAAAYGDPARNLSLMGELLEAIRERQLFLAYQPKYDLRQGRVTGVEALTRWRHASRGFISPDLFVTMAEETGHIGEMTDWVLSQALEDQARLSSAGQDLDMSVNLSGRLLADEAFISRMLTRLSGRRGSVMLEITETAVIDDPEVATRNIQRLADAHIGVSIDDYGSGLSSLAYLRQIPAQELKIDKAFVIDMDADARSALLVRSTIAMAHALGLKVTAEGVETATAQALLAGMGCDLAQGYFIARPMPLADLEAFLHEASGAARSSRSA